MSVASADIEHIQSTTMISSLSATTSGGAIGTTQITGAVQSEVFFPMGSDVLGGSTRVQCPKTFLKNTNSADDLTNMTLWLGNSIDDSYDGVILAGPITLQSDSGSDGSSYKARVIGFDSSGNPLQEEVIMNGTTLVQTTNNFQRVGGGGSGGEGGAVVCTVESRNVSTGALQTTNGNWSIGWTSSGTGQTIYGVLPAGYYTATGEVKFTVVPTLNDSTTSTSASSIPSGPASPNKPRTQASSTGIANGGTLTHGSAQGIWWKYTSAPGRLPSQDVQVALYWWGQTL